MRDLSVKPVDRVRRCQETLAERGAQHRFQTPYMQFLAAQTNLFLKDHVVQDVADNSCVAKQEF